jgi:hypothetical protein
MRRPRLVPSGSRGHISRYSTMNPPPGFAAHPGSVGPGAVPFVPELILILRGPGPRGSPRPIIFRAG